MGVLGKALGNAGEWDPGAAQKELGFLLAPGERIEAAYTLIRDRIVFTDLRLIMVDYQGLTGTKVSYHSVPWESISHFSVETAGTLDLDAELKVGIRGGMPLAMKFGRGENIFRVQAKLVEYTLRRKGGGAERTFTPTKPAAAPSWTAVAPGAKPAAPATPAAPARPRK